MTSGPWMDDADPVWRTVVDLDSSRDPCITQAQLIHIFGPDLTTAAEEAWSLDPAAEIQVFTGSNVNYGNGEFFQQDVSDASDGSYISCEWDQVWLTFTTADATVDSSTLPASVYDPSTGTYSDPAVTGVEWEPTSTAIAQELDVNVSTGQQHASSAFSPGDTFTVHIGGATTGPFAPGALTADQIRAMSSPGVVQVDTNGTPQWLTFTPDLPLAPGQSMGITALDEHTETGTAYSTPSTIGKRIDYPLWVMLRRQYRPRYRLLYGGGVSLPPIRQVQRGDGLGMSSAPRAIQHRSQQATLRNISFL